MKYDDIRALWAEDSEIDLTDLANESVKIPKLHGKYHNIYSKERVRLRQLEAEYKVLKKAKYEFYSQGPSKEQVDAGWQLPAKGMILKADVPMYLDADPNMIELSLKIGLQQEKVDFLEGIVRSLHSTTGFSSRANIIKNAIDFRKWTEGG